MGAGADFPSIKGPFLRLRLSLSCLIDPPGRFPFEVAVPFVALSPHESYTFQVVHGSAPHGYAETPLTIYEAPGELEIVLPERSPTDSEPFTIGVSGVMAVCDDLPPAEVEGDVITLHLPSCPRPLGLQAFDVPVGPLPAGEYEVRAFVHRHFPPARLAKARLRVHDSQQCVPQPDVLCLGGGRFAVSVDWQDFDGATGVGRALPLLDDTGLFWFFHPENVELMVKVLDACDPFGHFWVFVASGSTVEYEVRVTDTLDDETKFYRNASGNLPELIPDTGAFLCP
jgi:hypothetical protein